ALIVPHPFPPALFALFDNFRMVETDVAVQRDSCANPIAIENFHDPEHADPVAIVTDRPGRDIGNFAWTESAWTCFERKNFNIGNDPPRATCAGVPLQTWPTDGRAL